ncbi:hypothetical protein BDR04DRAFT_1095637 [Suillus decipiens]|nr:hypothetical protein BDR04DRAFT_1095637 [Suillus decipiens]
MVVSNSPSWWPTISSNILFSYWKVAAGVVVLYDWSEQDSVRKSLIFSYIPSANA